MTKEQSTVIYVLVFSMLSMGLFADTQKQIPADHWPGTKYAKVIAVTYDYTQEAGNDASWGEPHVVIDGRLHKGAFSISTPLTAEQQKALFDAITDEDFASKEVAKCFHPHHGFVFYDKNDKIVGSISICLKCGTKMHQPVGDFASVWRFDQLRELLADLKAPILKSNESYTKAYKNNESNKTP